MQLAKFRPALASSGVLGVIVALLAWNVAFAPAAGGLDGSWITGLEMAAHRGLHFGTQIVWTYGPLGFLAPLTPSNGGTVFTGYAGLAEISFAYLAALQILICVSLVWTLRRATHVGIAVIISFLAIGAFPGMTRTLVLAAIWCLAVVGRPETPLARQVVVYGGGAFAALEALLRLSEGPVILLMCAVALAVGRTWRRDLAVLLGIFVASLLVFWFAAGQSIGNLPDFARAAEQIVSGYSEAQPIGNVPGWEVPAAGAGVAVLLAGAALSAPPGRRRIAAVVLVGLVSFVTLKEGLVRQDEAHSSILFGTAFGLALAIPWRPDSRVIAAGTAVLLAVFASITALPHSSELNPATNIDSFVTQARTFLSSERRDRLIAQARQQMFAEYRLPPRTLALLRGKRVDVEPWEAAVAWAYRLNWVPAPTFQGYQAYTSELDSQNAETLGSPAGPDRVLRENPAAVEGVASPGVDYRAPAWDPPAAQIALLCNFRPLQTTRRWQVLGRVPDRCSEPTQLRSVQTSFNQPVAVPRVGPHEMLIAKIHGAGVSGLEKLRTFLYRARYRYVAVNRGKASYRLVPGTAADGLLLTVPPDADFPAPFSISPGVRELELMGETGPLTIDFLRAQIRALPNS